MDENKEFNENICNMDRRTLESYAHKLEIEIKKLQKKNEELNKELKRSHRFFNSPELLEDYLKTCKEELKKVRE